MERGRSGVGVLVEFCRDSGEEREPKAQGSCGHLKKRKRKGTAFERAKGEKGAILSSGGKRRFFLQSAEGEKRRKGERNRRAPFHAKKKTSSPDTNQCSIQEKEKRKLNFPLRKVVVGRKKKPKLLLKFVFGLQKEKEHRATISASSSLSSKGKRGNFGPRSLGRSAQGKREKKNG